MSEINLLEDFSRKTGIRAFAFANSSRTWIERCFWFAAISVCIGFTISDVSRAINMYLSHPTATRVKILNNRSLEFGSPTFCVEIALNHMISKNFMADTNNVLNLFKSVRNLTWFLKYLSNEMTLDRQEVNSDKVITVIEQNSTLNSIISLVTIVLTSIVRAQHSVQTSGSKYDYFWGYTIQSKAYDSNGTKIVNLVTHGSETTASVALYLSENGYSFSEMLPIVAEILCHKMLFATKSTRIYNGGKRSKEVCSAAKISWLGPAPFNPNTNDLLCMGIDKSFFSFSTIEDVTTIMVDLKKLYTEEALKPDGWVYLDFAGEPVFFPRSQNVFYAEIGSQINVNIQLQGIHKKVKTPINDCSMIPEENCLFQCRNRYIQKYCGCNPLLDTEDNKNSCIPMCGTYKGPLNQTDSRQVPGFERCLIIREASFPPLPDCDSNCKQELCESFVLTFILTPRSRFDDSKLPTYMRFYAETFQFPLMEEVSLYGAKELIGFLGGNLSFYLGANFLVLLHTILYWIQAPFWHKHSVV